MRILRIQFPEEMPAKRLELPAVSRSLTPLHHEARQPRIDSGRTNQQETNTKQEHIPAIISTGAENDLNRRNPASPECGETRSERQRHSSQETCRSIRNQTKPETSSPIVTKANLSTLAH